MKLLKIDTFEMNKCLFQENYIYFRPLFAPRSCRSVWRNYVAAPDEDVFSPTFARPWKSSPRPMDTFQPLLNSMRRSCPCVVKFKSRPIFLARRPLPMFSSLVFWVFSENLIFVATKSYFTS